MIALGAESRLANAIDGMNGEDWVERGHSISVVTVEAGGACAAIERKANHINS